MNLSLARVVRVNPGRGTMDVVDINTAEPIAGVSVVSGAMSSDTGFWGVPNVEPPRNHAEGASLRPGAAGGRVMIAVLAAGPGGRPLAIGFIRPSKATGGTTEDADDFVFRHPAGTAVGIKPDGRVVVSVPGGTTLTMRPDGAVDVVAPAKMTFTTPLAEFSEDVRIMGDLQVDGTGTATADFVGGGKSLKGHRHQETGGITNPPQ